MNTPNTNLSIQSVNPKDLAEQDIVRLNEVSQDMWASEAGLWELAQCTSCSKMHSKEDVFWDLPKELFSKTVAEIMTEIGMHDINCHACGSKTRMVYGPENVEFIKERIREEAFLVLCLNDQKKIVGFEEWYISSLQRIFDLDLHYHYKNVGLPEIRARVSRALGGNVPPRMLVLSSIGLLEPYRNFNNLFEILNQFSRAIPDKYIDLPGITELDKDNVIHRMSAKLNTGISLGINSSPEWQHKITNIGEKYNTDLIVYRDPVRIYKENFTHGSKQFLRLARDSRPKIEVLTTATESEVVAA